MRYIWKCTQCETGPCYCCAANNFCSGDAYVGSEAYPPAHCPFSAYDETPEWEPLEPLNHNNPGYQNLLDWFNGEGWDNASPALRDAIMSNWFELKTWCGDGAGYATGLLNELEATSPYQHHFLWEEMKSQVKKISKPALVAATWNRAFQVGLMMAEKIRVELEERQKNHKPPFEHSDY